MENLVKAIRGMNDILPTETHHWQYIENTLKDTLHSFGYHEIRLPIVEKTELFKRTIGEATDIVEKEMYTFSDRNDENLTLRPEGTAGCVRAGLEHGLFYHQIQRLWYMGPNFRYERPQKGRYRQFHQCGAETFGLAGPDIDAEMILLCALIFEKLGLKDYVTLELNSLGSVESRTIYRQALVDYFTEHQALLDEDSQRRLLVNPLRILDSKNPSMQSLIINAPKMMEYLDDESAQHFEQLQHYLTAAGVRYTINPCLVRGLDYYTKTVFEWVTDQLGAQATVAAGGRYDGLIEQLGGKPTPALGFAIGMERMVLLLQQTEQALTPVTPHVYLMTSNDDALKKAFELSYQLRKNIPELRLIMHCGNGSLKNQFKKADKSQAEVALIIGEEELRENTITIKQLRIESPQLTLPQAMINDYLVDLLGLR